MTKEQVNKLFRGTRLTFLAYTKYYFTFGTDIGDYLLVASLGGRPEDIYELEITASGQYLFLSCDDWFAITVEDSKGNTVFQNITE